MIRNKKMDKEKMRQSNLFLILRILKERGSLSKTDLSKITKLSLPSVTSIINELEEYNLISLLGQAPIKRGRFPIKYKLNSNALYIIGVTIQSESIKCVIINLNGDIQHYLSIPLPTNHEPAYVLDKVSNLVQKVIAESGINQSKILGIGVGMHGIVDPINGVAIYPPHLGWEHIPLSEILEDKLNLPVLVDNDCNVLTLAERWFGKCINSDSFIVMNVDYGVGSGIMVSGNLFHGTNYGGGQIGHLTVSENGPKCSCGNFGCLETLVNENALLNGINKKLKQGFNSVLVSLMDNGISLKDIYVAATKEDQLSIQTLEEAGRYLGVGVSSLVNLFNPQQIILTGSVLVGEEFITIPLKDTVNKTALKTNTKNLKIETSDLGDKADVIGAATLWVDSLFNGHLQIDDYFSKEGIM
ncbi:ROK family transcriptional regulator [Pseudogracilibacillus sp. SO30301A]|uniref:ROK family transcriptional regulator n=1 Tax=Pseudogracilibacillus sp. SO30301A TaxID=3098291 RepID=UPI00300DC980